MNPHGWLPVRIHPGDARGGGQDSVDWAYLAGVDFADPFFDQTVERALRSPFRLLFRPRRPLDSVATDAGKRARDPEGLVLHMSRCGSTLLVNCLRARPDTVVHSEPGPLETVLAATGDRELRVQRFRALVRSMAPDDPEAAYIVKLDAWATLDLPDVLAAFPEVPWVFVSRDPGEVLVSHQRLRGYHVIPGTLPPARTHIQPEDAAGMDLDEYAAAVLGRILLQAYEGVRLAGARARVVDHGDLPNPGLDVAADHLGVPVSAAVRSEFARIAERDAKNPVLPYLDDRAEKRRALTPKAAGAVERYAAEPYRLLRTVAMS